MNIYEIKERTEKTSPYFFSRDTLKFFHQTMKSFSVKKLNNGKYYISAPMKDHSGRKIGMTERYFNPDTNQLEHVEKD